MKNNKRREALRITKGHESNFKNPAIQTLSIACSCVGSQNKYKAFVFLTFLGVKEAFGSGS